MPATVLVTGFEPFAEWRINPSGEVAGRLDGAAVGGARVAGRVLPVRLRGLEERVRRLVEEVRPLAVIGTGLAPGSPVVRLERFAVNLADFRIPDDEGAAPRDAALEAGGALALASRLPLRSIAAALLDAGIPAALSNSAGTYLCNALMYRVLAACEGVPAGFVHLPNPPEQVAAALRDDDRQPAALASMSPDLMLRAIEIVVATTVESATPAAAS